MIAPWVITFPSPAVHCEVSVAGSVLQRQEKVPASVAVETPGEVLGELGVKVTGR